MKKYFISHLFLALVALFLTFALSKTSLFSDFELKSLDFRFLMRGKQVPESSLVIVGIDDASIARFGRWPWPRSYHSELLKAFSEYPPRVVGFDLLFPQKEEQHPEYDEVLVYSGQLLDHLVLANYFEIKEEASLLSKLEEQKRFESSYLPPKALQNVEGDLSLLIQAKGVTLPFPELAQVTEPAFINAPRDADGVIRRIPLVMAYEGRVYPSFVLQLLIDYWRIPQKDIKVICGKGIELKPREGSLLFIPTDQQGNLLINFVGEHFDFKEYLFVQVINSLLQKERGEKTDIDLEFFRKKIVLVGLTATGTTDMGAFPFSDHSPLIAIHANALNTILSQNFLIEITPTLKSVLLIAVTLMVLIFSSFLTPFKSALTSFLLLIGLTAGNYACFLFGFWVPFVAPVFIWILVYLLITTFRYFTEEREKKYVRKAFGQYVSPNILKELLEDPSKLKLGGERRELTVLFSDIRSFTTFCESRQPEEVVEMLNEYLDKMTEVIFKHNGTLDKYVGDAIVAFFGAPSAKLETDHAMRACRAALEMIEALKKLQAKWQSEGKALLDIGIGLNTGPMLVGNMGSRQKYDYTVIGDHVNLGARLEGLTRKFNCHIILSESTLQHASNDIQVKELEEVMVKGKNLPVKVYELLSLK